MIRTAMAAEIFAGRRRASIGIRVFESLDGIAGKMICLECDGTGEWPYGPTPAECGRCVECKGSGSILVSI